MDHRGVWLVVLILAVGLAGGSLAAYRMHVQQDWVAHGPPMNVTVTIEWPDGGMHWDNVTLQGGNTTALGALFATADAHGFVVRTSFFSDFGGEYVYSIDGHAAEPGGRCGWMYAVNGADADRAADTIWLNEGDTTAWRWDCI